MKRSVNGSIARRRRKTLITSECGPSSPQDCEKVDIIVREWLLLAEVDTLLWN
jgi:hypothetical protein